jgi:APA family basic amino acid/polyamine antiporter
VNVSGSLARRLGTTDAVVIGLGSMIGAGVFAAFGPAAVYYTHNRDHET